MKFDMELVRTLLLWCEDNLPDKTRSYLASELTFEGYTTDQILYHVALLAEGGYLDVLDASTHGGEEYFIRRLTFEGTQFLEGIKSDTVWNGMKEEAQKIGVKVFISAVPVILQIMAKMGGLT